MFNTGRAQRAGNRASRQGNNANNTIARIAPDISKNVSATRPAKRTRVASIGDSNASGLIIQGSHEHPQEEGTNPNGTDPPNSMVGTERPDFPISFSGRGIPKFVSNIRLAGIDGSTSISGDLTVGGTFSAPGGITGFVSTTETSDQAIASSLSTTSIEQSIDVFSGSITTLGGVGIVKDVQIGGTTTSNAIVTNSTQTETAEVFSSLPSTSETTGALVVTGGVGIGGDIHMGGDVYHTGDIKHLGSTSGTLTLAAAPVTTDHTLTFPDAIGNKGDRLSLGTAGQMLWSDNFNSTGVKTGGVVSVNGGDDTLYDITDGRGIINDVQGATYNEITWSGLTAEAITDPAPLQPGDAPTSSKSGRILTFVSIDSSGNAVTTAEKPNSSKSRKYIYLGVLVHVNGSNLNTVNNQQAVLDNSTNGLRDLADVLGFINVTGNTVSYTNTLNLTKTDGTMFAFGANYSTDKNNPHVVTLPAIDTSTTGTFQIRFQDGSSSALTLTDFIIDMLDDGTAYPGSTTLTNNYYAVWRVYSFTSNALKIQAPQFEYAALSDAIANINVEAYVKEPSLNNGILIGYITVREGNDLTTATFLSAPTLGGGGVSGSGSIPSMQTTYNNSVSPQLLLTSALGALEIQDAATPTGGTLFSVKDSVGSSVLDVSATQVTVVKDMNVTGDLTITGDTTLNNVTDSTTTSNGALVLTGGAGIAKQVTCNKLKTTDITDSSSTVTGSARIVGGLGVAKTLWCDKLMVDDTTNSTSTSTGSVIINGGAVVKKNLYADQVYTTYVQAQNGATTFRLGANVTSGQIQIGEALNNAKPVLIGNNSRYQLGIEASDFYGGLVMEVLSATNPLNLVMKGGSSSIFRFGRSITTGDVEIMEDQTTGDVKIGSVSATTGRVLVNCPVMQCLDVIRAPNLETSASSTPLNVGTNITTGNVAIGGSLSGRSNSASGTGITTIGDTSGPYLEIFHHNTGEGINIRTANGGGDGHADLVIRGTADSLMYFGSTVSTGTVSIAPSITTGVVDIGTAQTEGDITIGSAGATTGEITLQSNNFKSSSFTILMEDAISNSYGGVSGTVYWERMGRLVFVSGKCAWTGHGSATATAVQLHGFDVIGTAHADCEWQSIQICNAANGTFLPDTYEIPSLIIQANSDYWQINLNNYTTSGNTTEYAAQADVKNGTSSFYFSGVYRIN